MKSFWFWVTAFLIRYRHEIKLAMATDRVIGGSDATPGTVIASQTFQQFQMNRYISQFLEFYRRKEKLLGLDFNQFSNFFYLHQLALSIYF